MVISNKKISLQDPTYFIADIAANHDGDINRAVDLIYLAAETGADAAKFQHFKASTIVSKLGFEKLGDQKSHQSKWKKSVFDVYKDAEVNPDWTPILREACEKAGITFFTSPYSIELVDAVDDFVPAYKIGSGDITWLEIIRHIASKQKPYIIASGASSIEDVKRAIEAGQEINPDLALLQCNTNYTASLENFKYIQLNVLNTYKELFPGMVLGLSDHTPGHATVLGAVTLGARIIEKHFTDNINRTGPDHLFSMDPTTWKEMVHRTRELENALGNGVKKVEENEMETVVLQRRSVRAVSELQPGHVLTGEDLIFLRPCPEDGFPPYEAGQLIGKTLSAKKEKGDYFSVKDFE
jgi:sialic acid synthase SpsE